MKLTNLLFAIIYTIVFPLALVYALVVLFSRTLYSVIADGVCDFICPWRVFFTDRHGMTVRDLKLDTYWLVRWAVRSPWRASSIHLR